MTDLRDQIAASFARGTWCGTGDERIAEIVRPVIAAHEAEVVGGVLDRIDALHVEHDCERDGKDIRWECFIIHGGACANVGRCRGCGLAQNAPCPTRRLTAEIRGELSHG